MYIFTVRSVTMSYIVQIFCDLYNELLCSCYLVYSLIVINNHCTCYILYVTVKNYKKVVINNYS